MTKINTKTITKPGLSVKAQTFAAVGAIAAAVLLPQALHVLGKASGIGTALGEVFLPMHLPIILAGLLAGSYVGAIAGLFGPLLSFLLTGMPGAAMLPFMMLELFCYGLLSGLLRNHRMPTLAKVVTTQVFGRAIRAIAILFSVYVLGSNRIPAAIIISSIQTGMIGIALQWMLIPLIVYRVEAADRHA